MILREKVEKDLQESSLSRVYGHYKEHDSGTISAFRGNRSKSENLSASAQLKSKLIAKGFGVTKIDGVYIENYGTKDAQRVSEESYFVVDLKDTNSLERVLCELGTLFEQDSITFSRAPNSPKPDAGAYYLIGTSPFGAYPGKGKKIKLGKPMFGDNGEFYSSVNGRPFIFK